LLVPRDNWGLLGEGVWTRQSSVPTGLTKPCPFTIRYDLSQVSQLQVQTKFILCTITSGIC